MIEPDDPKQQPHEFDGVPAPPRLLLWGLVAIFVLGIIGSFAALYVFKNVLTTGQQYRVMTMAPFMEAFMPARSTPQGGIVPTAGPQQNTSISPEDLLNMPLGVPEATPVIQPTTAVPTSVPVEPTATFTPTPAPTMTPTATETPLPTETTVDFTATPVTQANSSSADNPSAARMYGFRHEQQTWNNCGPANITMALSYYGWTRDQAYAAEFLKPGGKEDKNVSPGEMVAFVNDQTDVRALTRMGGTLDLLKTFISRNFPVVIETGYMPEGYDWIGHYQTVVGYDDARQVFYIYDSFLGIGENGEGISETYDVIDNGWEDFNRTFIVVYEPSREGEVREILGERADLTRAAEIAFDTEQNAARANPQNAFAWFNMGSALTKLGRYEEAAAAYDRARQIGLPFRMLWYQFGPFEAYFNVGRYEDVLSLAEVNLTNGASEVEETYYWQGQVYAQQGLIPQATEAFRLALRHNPRYTAAQTALESLSGA